MTVFINWLYIVDILLLNHNLDEACYSLNLWNTWTLIIRLIEFANNLATMIQKLPPSIEKNISCPHL